MNIVSAKSCSIEVRKQSLTHLLAQSHNTPTIMNEYIGYSPNNPSLQSYISWVRALYSYSKIYKSEHRIYRIQHLDWPFSECECKNLTKAFDDGKTWSHCRCFVRVRVNHCIHYGLLFCFGPFLYNLYICIYLKTYTVFTWGV